MLDQFQINHHIQKYILRYLITTEYARFTDLKPPNADSNLSTYHLKQLVHQGLVKKTAKGYTLTIAGLMYVDRVNAKKVFVRKQPKIITMLFVQNSKKELLLQLRQKQPFINTWTLPYGKLHIDDLSILSAAKRESKEKLNYEPTNLNAAGNCYIRVMHDAKVITSTLAHIYKFTSDSIYSDNHLQWISPLKTLKLKLAPATRSIIEKCQSSDDYFFEEFTEEINLSL